MLLAERQLPRITDIQFYDNVVDTRTPGLDGVATHDRDSLSGELTLTGALHFNETEITAGRDNFAPYRQSYIEEGNPRQRRRLAAGAADETFDLPLGVNYFGKAVRQKVNPGRGRVPWSRHTWPDRNRRSEGAFHVPRAGYGPGAVLRQSAVSCPLAVRYHRRLGHAGIYCLGQRGSTDRRGKWNRFLQCWSCRRAAAVPP